MWNPPAATCATSEDGGPSVVVVTGIVVVVVLVVDDVVVDVVVDDVVVVVDVVDVVAGTVDVVLVVDVDVVVVGPIGPAHEDTSMTATAAATPTRIIRLDRMVSTPDAHVASPPDFRSHASSGPTGAHRFARRRRDDPVRCRPTASAQSPSSIS